MANYFSNKVQLNATGANTIMPKFLEDGDITVVANTTVGAVVLGVGDTIQLCDIPPNCQFTGFQVDSDKIDGGATLAFKIGTIALPQLFGAGIVVGQAGGYAYQTVNGVLGTSFTATTRLVLTVTTAAASAPAAGTGIRVVFNYNADP